MRIAFFEVKGWEKKYLEKGLKGHKLLFFEESLSLAHIPKIKSIEGLGVFIYSKVNKGILKKLPKLKIVVTKSTGFDHIDIKECKKRKIAACNVPFYGENTVAEHTFALMLALSRNVHKSYVRTLNEDYTIEGLKGFDLKGKTLGVIGGGHIGMHVVRIARAFEMDVIVFDLHMDNFMASVLGYRYGTMDEVLGQSDILTLHVPHNEHTHHLINKDSIKKIKKGALLINTARGGIVDTDALLEALDKGILRGAGLDVIEGEALIKEEKQLLHDKTSRDTLTELRKDHELLKRDNVVFTPHIAFYSQEALERILNTTIQNLVDFSEGKVDNSVMK